MKEPTISTVSSIRFPCRTSASLPDAKRLDISLPMARRRHGLPVGSGRAGHDLTWGCLRPSARLPPTAARVRIRSRTKSVSVPKTVHLATHGGAGAGPAGTRRNRRPGPTMELPDSGQGSNAERATFDPRRRHYVAGGKAFQNALQLAPVSAGAAS